ncbi:MAG: trypsin-like peptidase domain-containing protein [Proteobacteria bacterium]|nr:trypsin-like peptidase domain-containing protein [Pseudomonadota bacterium]
MKTVYRSLIFIGQFVTLGLAAAFLISLFSPGLVERVRHRFAPAPAASVATAVPSVAESAPDHGNTMAGTAQKNAITVSYAPAVARAAPAVVSIYANKIVSTGPQVLRPANPVLQRMFPGIIIGPPLKRREQSLGSGVIVGHDGYVLTNNHVIQGAEQIQVVLYDGNTIGARVIGTDAETDLAVLKIDAPNLPSIAIADKTPLNVGDVVLAIGNPFGLGRTVTMGIVSALGRQLNLSTYEDFIQTDAAINQGNSGGALVNAYGELVGINSDIFSPTGGNVGIGFAIPVSTAKAVLDQIVAHGRVIRGWLGAEYADVGALQNPGADHGVAVVGIYDKGPAALAGLRPGDVLFTLDGKPITSQLELRNREASLAPGTSVQLTGERNGAPFSMTAVLQERPQRQAAN